nr:MAG TPA: hypothetical protein [Bacteriophage sp.]
MPRLLQCLMMQRLNVQLFIVEVQIILSHF